MIVDITNQVLTDIKRKLNNITVLSSYQSTINEFPVVIVEESDNSTNLETKDSSGFTHVNIGFRIEIYTKGNRRMSEAKSIRNKVDEVMSGEYNMSRHTPTVIPNYLDNSIYRYRLNYTGIIDGNEKIYRG